MKDAEFLSFLLEQGARIPPEQCGAALLVLISLRLNDVCINAPKSGLVTP